MVTVDDVGLGGTTSSKPSSSKGTAVDQSTAGTTQTKQQTTNQTTSQSANPTAKQESMKSDITPVNADDDFLRGFNEGYEEKPETPSYMSQQATTQTSNTSAWDDSRKELSHKGITETTDSFLDGFNEVYEDKQEQTILPSKRGSPNPEGSGYTGAWEAVQPDTTGSGFQIHAWTEDPQPKTEEELKTAYERAKSRFDAVSQELERYMRDNQDWNTPWYDALSREYGNAWEQYSTFKEQYEEQFPDNRVWGVIAGSGMDYAGQMLSAAGTMVEGMAEYFPAYGPYQNEIVGFNPSAYVPERDTTLITEYVSDPLREKGADISQKGQAMVQDQKKGLGKFGQFAVDLGSAATQMVFDIGLGVVTGGGMAIPAAIRTFGASATEAAAEGADLNQQMLYATTSAAATYGIEQLCNVAYAGLKGIAPGITDDVITAGVENLAQKLASTPKGAEALKNIGMLIASGVGEGVEETLESLLNPFLQQLSYDKNAETFLQNPKLLYSALYDGAIGGILGMFGRGTNTAIDLVDNLIHNNIMPGEKLMETAGVSEPEVLGAIVLNDMAKTEGTADGQATERQTPAVEDFQSENDSRTGVYTDQIKWGIHDIDVRPDGKGFWGKRLKQTDPRVDSYELKINPQNESYYLPHPDGGYVQFENMENTTVQDGKLVVQQKSFYHVNDMPEFAKKKVLEEALRQTTAAQAAEYKVEWLVSDETAVSQLKDFFQNQNVDIIVTYYPE